MTRILNGQVIFALALTALNTVYASQVLQMDLPFASGEPGPAFLPSMLCIFIYLAVARILFTVGLTVLFIIGFFYLGYLVSAFLYTFMIAFFFDFERRGVWLPSALLAAAIAFGVTLFGWLFFVQVFELYLPVWEF